MKTAYILIGPSGAGKSTKTQELLREHESQDVTVFSLDTCRMNFYSVEKFDYSREENVELYRAAFDHASSNAKAFDEFVANAWNDALQYDVVIVDNTNLTKKSRARWVQDLRRVKTANQMGFKIIMIEFHVPLNVLIERQSTRPDKEVPIAAVRQQYFRQEEALLGSECDEVRVCIS